MTASDDDFAALRDLAGAGERGRLREDGRTSEGRAQSRMIRLGYAIEESYRGRRLVRITDAGRAYLSSLTERTTK